MKCVKSIIAVALLAGVVYAVGQGFVIAGWQGAGITLLFMAFFIGIVKSITDTLLAPFTPRRGD